MRIIIIRHGDPDYEKDCLTELGHKQAALAAKRLMVEGIETIFHPHFVNAWACSLIAGCSIELIKIVPVEGLFN